MAYSEKAKQLRRCTATKKDGSPCRAYAMWGHSEQVCSAHAGRTRGPSKTPQERIRAWEANWQTKRTVTPLANGGSVATEITRYKPQRETRQPSCKCAAYPFPHRPGSGFCRWPDDPLVETKRHRVSQFEAITRWGIVLKIAKNRMPKVNLDTPKIRELISRLRQLKESNSI